MASEQFSLCWDNFHKNMSSGMNSLLENEDLVDVTLAVQGKCLKAHKMVLSVCSPYFKELFKSNPCQHPIVFMKDVSYEALSDLLQFMYQGEVQVSQENLTTFIKTAEALQIKGLTGDGNGTTEPEHETPQEQPVHHVEGYKPVPRPKKMAPAPIPTSPQVKRQRLSVSSSESQPLPPSITKTEPAPTPSTGTSEAPVQFKMEPYDQSHNLVDETGDDNFGDDTLDDNTVDDSEDYSMMEGGVGEEEPQAGTSTDGAGEGQGVKYVDKKLANIKCYNTNFQLKNNEEIDLCSSESSDYDYMFQGSDISSSSSTFEDSETVKNTILKMTHDQELQNSNSFSVEVHDSPRVKKKRGRKIRAGNKLRPPCFCRQDCHVKFSDKQRHKIIQEFRSLSFSSKKQFVADHIEEVLKYNPKKLNNKHNSQHFTKRYFLPHIGGVKVQVCQLMFTNTLDVSTGLVTVVCKDKRKLMNDK